MLEVAAVIVQRAESPSGIWSDLTSSPLMPTASMVFVDSDVAPGTSYWYRLRLSLQDGSEELLRSLDILVPSSSMRTAHLLAPSESSDGRQVDVRFRVEGGSLPIQLDIFDVRGRLVRCLDRRVCSPGEHSVSWNRLTESGARTARGTYLVRLMAGGSRVDAKKLTLPHR